MENKKIIMPTILAVVTLIALVVGATYAYFTVGTTNNFGTTTKASATAASVGTVALSAGSSISLSVTASDMMRQSNDVEYYATTSGTPVTTQSTPITIGTATVTGGGTYNCSYTLTVTPSNTGGNSADMLTKLKAMTSPEPTTGQLILYVNGTQYDLFSTTISTSTPLSINGTMNSLTSTANITAQLKLVNKTGTDGTDVTKSQNDLAGTNVTLTFAVTSFTCTAV